MEQAQKPAAGTPIVYIGSKPRKTDHLYTNLTWEGFGDVKQIADPGAAAKLLRHPDVFALYDPANPPTRDAVLAAARAARTGPQPTGHPTPAAEIAGHADAGAPNLDRQDDERFLDIVVGALPRFVRLLRADDALAKAIEGDFGLVLPDDDPGADDAPDLGAFSRDEREVMLANLRRQAEELGIQVKGNWGIPKLTEEIRQATEAASVRERRASRLAGAAQAAEAGGDDLAA